VVERSGPATSCARMPPWSPTLEPGCAGRSFWLFGVVPSKRDGVAVVVEVAGVADDEPLGLAGEQVPAGPGAHPPVERRSSLGGQRRVHDVEGGLDVGGPPAAAANARL